MTLNKSYSSIKWKNSSNSFLNSGKLFFSFKPSIMTITFLFKHKKYCSRKVIPSIKFLFKTSSMRSLNVSKSDFVNSLILMNMTGIFLFCNTLEKKLHKKFVLPCPASFTIKKNCFEDIEYKFIISSIVK